LKTKFGRRLLSGGAAVLLGAIGAWAHSPAALAVNCSTTGSCVAPDKAWGVTITDTDTTTPLFSAGLSGRLGTSVTGSFFLYDSAGNSIGGSPTATGVVPNGERLSYRVPPGVLTLGATYKLSVKACYDSSTCTPAPPTRPTLIPFTLSTTQTTPPTTTPPVTVTLNPLTSVVADTSATAAPAPAAALKAGTDGASTWVSGIKPDLSGIPIGSTVQSATLSLDETGCLTTCAAVTAAPADADVTTQSTGAALAAAADPTVLATDPAATNGRHNLDVTTAAAAWLAGTNPNYGLVLTASGGGAVYSSATAALSITYLPPAAPGAPTAVQAIAGDSGALVSWAEPVNTGVGDIDDPISGYTVQILNTSGTVVKSAAATGATAVVTGLTNGVAYSVRVQATNRIGAGDFSTTTAFTPVAATGGAQQYVDAAQQFLTGQNALQDGTATTADGALAGASRAAMVSSLLTSEAPSDAGVYTAMAQTHAVYTADQSTVSDVLISTAGSTTDVYLTANRSYTTLTGTDTTTPDSTPGAGTDHLDLTFAGTPPVLTRVADTDAVVAKPDGSMINATSDGLDPPVAGAPVSVARNADGTFPSDPNVVLQPMATPSLGGTVAWARAHYNGGYNGFKDDCTDFASRSLYYGGGMHQRTYWLPASKTHDDHYWFQMHMAAGNAWSTYSWGGAYHHANFEYLEGGQYASYLSQAVPGDLIFANWSGSSFSGIGHVAVITKVSKGVIFVTQHSNNRIDSPLSYGANSWYKGHPNLTLWIVKPHPSYY
jgi:hypothetical protein